MKPIELMPEGERRGRVSALRTGPLPFIVIGGLIALLAGMVLLATTSNQISDSRAEIAELEVEKTTVEAQAQALQPYVDFLQLEQQREATVSELADSRFDWVRTIRELSLVIPRNVWLTELTASAAAVAATEGESPSSASSISGPSLQVSGCATGQDAVAGFVAAVKQIDGVTRVGLAKSAFPEGEEEEGGAEGGTSEGCPAKSYVAQFDAVIAFDAAPKGEDASALTEAPVNEVPEETTAPAE